VALMVPLHVMYSISYLSYPRGYVSKSRVVSERCRICGDSGSLTVQRVAMTEFEIRRIMHRIYLCGCMRQTGLPCMSTCQG
jgi:hypothetical protein